MDFLQNTEGLQTLLKQMDEIGLEKAVIFGLPVKKKWAYHDQREPSYYLDGYSTCFYYTLTDELLAQAYLSLNAHQQQRLAPLICGFNPTDLSSLDYLQMMYEKYPIWRGVGELLLRHDELSTMTNDELPRVNHKALEPIFGFCQEKKLPVMVHHNCSSVGYAQDFVYQHELKEVLDQFPDLKLVWAHCGASRRTMNGKYHQMMENMLNQYPHLSADISWVVYEQEICAAHKPKPEWIELFQHHSERFTIGSDVFGHFDDLKEKITRYNTLLDLLPPEVAERLGWKNAETLWFNNNHLSSGPHS